MTGIYAWINLAEATLWSAMAVVVLTLALKGGRRRGCFVASRGGMIVLAITLAAFGASDVVETYTGAWWRPWWLLAWKGACVMVLLGFAAGWVKRRAAR